MIHSKCDFSIWEIFIFFRKTFFSLQNNSTIVSDEMQQGDMYENTRGTPTAFNPDLSHTSKTLYNGNCFCYIFIYFCFSLSLSLAIHVHSGKYFPKPKSARKNIAINQIKLYMWTLDYEEGWAGKGSCIINSAWSFIRPCLSITISNSSGARLHIFSLNFVTEMKYWLIIEIEFERFSSKFWWKLGKIATKTCNRIWLERF